MNGVTCPNAKSSCMIRSEKLEIERSTGGSRTSSALRLYGTAITLCGSTVTLS